MVNYPYLHFINLEYWYCVIYSLFGGTCTAVSVSIDGGVSGGGGTAETAAHIAGGVATTPVTLWGNLGGIFGTIGGVLFGVTSIIWALYSAIAFTISGLLLVLILTSLLGLLYIRYKELTLYASLPLEARIINPLKNRWEALLEDATSTDPKRWRRGVVEADGMLGELLAKLGYQGKTSAERLRSVPDSAFVTLPAAWEAHRVKNFVVAKLSNYILTQREAFRIMKLYEQVFEEFNFM
jgi:hypothetical protein